MSGRNQSFDVINYLLAAQIPILLFVALSPHAKNWLTQLFLTASQYLK